MSLKMRILSLAIAAVLCSGCSAFNPAAPTATPPWDEHLAATARAVVAATFFAPTITFTPSPTATITLTPSPTQVTPTLSPTPSLASCIRIGDQIQTGKAISVVDGDTILVDIAGQNFEVRYIGIQAPEDAKIKQPFGENATSMNLQLVEGKTIKMVKDTSETDSQGRLLRYVYVGDTFVNYEMVRLGLATAVATPPDTACFDLLHQAEHEADVKRAGLWSRWAPTKTPLGYGLEHMTDVPCDCYGPELDCEDFSSQMQAQGCYAYCNSLGLGDLFDLDLNRNRRACDGLP